MTRTRADSTTSLEILLQRVRDALESCAGSSGSLGALMAAQYASSVPASIEPAGFADACAQALVWGIAQTRLCPRQLPTAARRWLLCSTPPLERTLLTCCFNALRRRRPADGRQEPFMELLRRAANIDWSVLLELEALPPDEMAIAAFEQFLAIANPVERRAKGVFITPLPLVRCLVRSVNEALRTEFGLPDGWCDASSWSEVRGAGTLCPPGIQPREPFVRILDPAAGTGAFLLEIIAQIVQFQRDRFTACNSTAECWSVVWSNVLRRSVLPRLEGYEILLPAVIAAHLLLAACLASTGFDFHGAAVLPVRWADALALDGSLHDGVSASVVAPATVIVGNPPFAGMSTNASRWLDRLLRGQLPGAAANYLAVDGEPLGERKHWLHDDYVKFFRLAHWHIERAGCGVVGLITNHGYLDNPTFRGMRQQLLATFPRTWIVDLHGNRNKHESWLGKRREESVFAIGQGVALGLFCRPPHPAPAAAALHGELWGSRSNKLATLSGGTISTLATTTLAPTRPFYALLPRRESEWEEYARGMPLTEVMPVSSTATVTARDRLVIDIHRAALIQRLEEFANLEIADDVLRRRMFHRTRSPRYAAGDTRGWRMADARRKLGQEPNWQQHIRRCLYRPFDERWIFWTPWMVDWPRADIMDHLRDGHNVALLARRQSPAGYPAAFFWVTRHPVIDGVLRSDNRGSESVFPLYIETRGPDCGMASRRPCAAPERASAPANIAPAFIDRLVDRWHWTWQPAGTGDQDDACGPDDVLHYVYALFHVPMYRIRYAGMLRREFPRVLLPRDPELFHALAKVGRRLVALHLDPEANAVAGLEPVAWRERESNGCVESGFPRYRDNRVWINEHTSCGPVSPEVWQFTAGVHQVCRKWLKDRVGQDLGSAGRDHYKRLVGAVQQTLVLARTADQRVVQHDGWPDAFAL